MSDDRYGMALRVALEAVEIGARRSGRTTRMLDQVRDGDVVVCATAREVDRLTRLLAERRIKARVTMAAGHYDVPRPRAPGRIHFDHDWLRLRYLDAIEGVRIDLEQFAPPRPAPAGEAKP